MDEFKKLWEQMSKDELTSLTFDEFSSAYGGEKEFKSLWFNMKADDLTDLSYQDFKNAYNPKKKESTSASMESGTTTDSESPTIDFSAEITNAVNSGARAFDIMQEAKRRMAYTPQEESYLSEIATQIERANEPEKDPYLEDLFQGVGAGVIALQDNLRKGLDYMDVVLNRELTAFIPIDNTFKVAVAAADAVWDKISETDPYQDVIAKGDELMADADRYDKRITEYVKEGDVEKAVGAAVLGAAESAPSTAVAMLGGFAGLGAVGLASAGQKYDEIKDADLPEATKIINPLLTGTLEILTEKMGSARYGDMIKSSLKKSGKEATEELVKDGVKAWYANSFKKLGVYTAPVGEGLEELANSVAGDVVDKFTIDPGRKIGGTALDDFAVGFVSGGGTAIVGGSIQGLRKPSEVKTENKSIKEDVIKKTNDPKLAEEIVNDLPKNYSTESRKEMADLLTKKADLEEKKTSSSERTKPIFEKQIKEVDNRISEVVSKEEGLETPEPSVEATKTKKGTEVSKETKTPKTEQNEVKEERLQETKAKEEISAKNLPEEPKAGKDLKKHERVYQEQLAERTPEELDRLPEYKGKKFSVATIKPNGDISNVYFSGGKGHNQYMTPEDAKAYENGDVTIGMWSNNSQTFKEAPQKGTAFGEAIMKSATSKITTNDTKNQERIQSSVQEGKKPIQEQPIKESSGEEATASGILQTQKEVNEKESISPEAAPKSGQQGVQQVSVEKTEEELLREVDNIQDLQDLLSSGKVKWGKGYNKRMYEINSAERGVSGGKNNKFTDVSQVPIQPSPTKGTVKTFDKMLKDYSLSTGKVIKFRKPKSSRAYYSPASTAIASKPNDVRASIHEIGHSLDDKFKLVETIPEDKLNLIHKELSDLSVTGSTPGASIENKDRYIKSEGIGEWTTAYLINPVDAQKLAPEFTKHFKENVPQKYQKALNSLSEDIRNWFSLPASQRMSAAMEGKDTRTLKEKVYDVFNNPNFKKTGKDAFTQAFLNPNIVHERAWRTAVERAGISYDDVQGTKDFVKTTRLLLGHNNKVGRFFKDGMETFDGETVKDKGKNINGEYLLDPYLKYGGKDRDKVKAAIAYGNSVGVAQRTIELHNRLERDQIISDIHNDKLPPQEVLSQHGDLTEQYKDEIGIMIGMNKKPEPLSRYDFSSTDFSGAGGGFMRSYDEANDVINEHQSNKAADKALYDTTEEALRRYRFMADQTLKYALDAGRISKTDYDNIKAKNEHYISFGRIMSEDTGDIMPKVVQSSDGKIGVVSEPVKKIKGSRRTIVDPYVSLIDNMNRIIKESDRNAAIRSFTDILDINLSREIGEPGMITFDDIGQRVDQGEGPNTIKVFQKGEPVYYEFNKDIYDSLKDMGSYPEDLKWITRTIGAPVKILERSVTSFPVFAARNRIRDFWSRLILTKGDIGLSNFKNKKQSIKELNSAGGGQFGYHMTKNNYYDLMEDIIHNHTRKNTDIILDPIRIDKHFESYKRMLESVEQATRAEEYKSVYDKKIKEGLSPKDARVEAAYAARDLMDFAVQGKAIKYIKWMAPFVNPRIQGFRKMYRSMMHGTPKERLNVAKHFAVYGLVPLVLEKALIAAVGRDDDYNKLPTYRKYLFLNIPLGKNRWIMIPKPFEVGVMATLFTRPLDQAMLGAKESNLLEEAGWVAQTMSPLDPSTITGTGNPIINAIKNEDPFREQEIVPAYEKDLPLPLREGTKYASGVGQQFERFGVDPRKADYLINSMLPYWGRTATVISDIGREDKNVDLVRLTGFVSKDTPYSNKDYIAIREMVGKYNQYNAGWYKALKESVNEYYTIEGEEERAAYREELNKMFDDIITQLRQEEKDMIKEAKSTKK